jgi:hypothetical protein
MVQIKITNFGYTLIDGDHSIWAITGISAITIIAMVLLCRLYGRLHPEMREGDDEKAD